MHGHEVTVKAAESLMEGRPGSALRLLVSRPEIEMVHKRQAKKGAAAALPPAPIDVPESVAYEEKPIDTIVEKIVTVEKPVEIIVEKVVIKEVESSGPLEIEKVIYLDRPVERVVYLDRVVQVPVEVDREVPVEVLREVVREVPIEVFRPRAQPPSTTLYPPVYSAQQNAQHSAQQYPQALYGSQQYTQTLYGAQQHPLLNVSGIGTIL